MREIEAQDADHQKRHFAAGNRAHGVWLVCGKQNRLASREQQGLSLDGHFHFSFQDMEERVGGRGVLADFLCSVKGKQSEGAIGTAEHRAADDRSGLIRNGIEDTERFGGKCFRIGV